MEEKGKSSVAKGGGECVKETVEERKRYWREREREILSGVRLMAVGQ